jgi:hypothetical protein
MNHTEVVWRELLAREESLGLRRYANLASVAAELGLPVSTVHRALQRPMAIGAVTRRPGGGFSLVDPLRLLLLWAGHRDTAGDLVLRRDIGAAATDVERQLPEGFLLSGFGAVVARRGGNRVSDYDRVVCYGDPADLPDAWPVAEGGSSTVLEVHTLDPWLGRYGPVVPLCQAFVDLFNTPGWPAARFVESLIGQLTRFA